MASMCSMKCQTFECEKEKNGIERIHLAFRDFSIICTKNHNVKMVFSLKCVFKIKILIIVRHFIEKLNGEINSLHSNKNPNC